MTVSLKLSIYNCKNPVFNIIDNELATYYRKYSTDNMHKRVLGDPRAILRNEQQFDNTVNAIAPHKLKGRI